MDHFQRSARNPLRAFGLSRASERRRDGAWLSALRPRARVLGVYGEAFAVDEITGHPVPLDAAAEPSDADLIFLGDDGRHAWFARDCGDQAPDLPAGVALWDLRRAGLHMDAAIAGMLAYAKALCHWHRHNRFCGRCGAATEARDGGHRRVCTGPECNTEQFPRLDPAIIVRVTHRDRVLLGRQPHWPERRYSVLAGFVEPGESVEDAVRREVAEETALRLGGIEYHSSQPWPFPASLMLAFTAEAEHAEARVGEELESVRWFDHAGLAAAVRDGELRLPYRLSIAYRLLADWYERDGARLDAVAPGNGRHEG